MHEEERAHSPDSPRYGLYIAEIPDSSAPQTAVLLLLKLKLPKLFGI
jgi:hypothetical protein